MPPLRLIGFYFGDPSITDPLLELILSVTNQSNPNLNQILVFDHANNIATGVEPLELMPTNPPRLLNELRTKLVIVLRYSISLQ